MSASNYNKSRYVNVDIYIYIYMLYICHYSISIYIYHNIIHIIIYNYTTTTVEQFIIKVYVNVCVCTYGKDSAALHTAHARTRTRAHRIQFRPLQKVSVSAVLGSGAQNFVVRSTARQHSTSA